MGVGAQESNLEGPEGRTPVCVAYGLLFASPQGCGLQALCFLTVIGFGCSVAQSRAPFLPGLVSAVPRTCVSQGFGPVGPVGDITKTYFEELPCTPVGTGKGS